MQLHVDLQYVDENRHDACVRCSLLALSLCMFYPMTSLCCDIEPLVLVNSRHEEIKHHVDRAFIVHSSNL